MPDRRTADRRPPGLVDELAAGLDALRVDLALGVRPSEAKPESEAARQALARAVHAHRSVLHLPVRLADAMPRLVRAQRRLSSLLGREPRPAELARLARLRQDRVERLLAGLHRPVAPDEPLTGETRDTLADRLRAEETATPFDVVAARKEAARVEQALAGLPPREALVVRLRYGLGEADSSTLEEVGARLGVTRERARQIEARALGRLRRRLGAGRPPGRGPDGGGLTARRGVADRASDGARAPAAALRPDTTLRGGDVQVGALIRFDPFRDLSAMQARMNRLFDEVFGRQTGGSSSGDMAPAFVPAVDVWGAPDAYYLRVEVPGVNKDDVQIELTDGVLVIRGERKLGANLETEQRVRQEGTYGPFYRAVTLPGSAQAEKIQARVQHGVLEVIVPKTEEARTKLIPIAA